MKRAIAFFVLGGLLLASALATAHARERRVLLVHSYSLEYGWTASIDRSLEAELADLEDLNLRRIFMDTKQKTAKEWTAEITETVRQTISSFRPEVVVASDDNAQSMVVSHYLGKESPQFVFTGVNANLERYGFPASNVTGILERSYPNETLDLLRQIVPGVKSIVVLSDNSATANLVRSRLEGKSLPVKILAYEQPETFNSWKLLVRKYAQEASVDALMIPLYHTVRNLDGSTVPTKEVMHWTVENLPKPVVGLWDFTVEDGALCGVVINPEEHGRKAAWMTRRLLAGARASDLEVLTNKEGFVCLNTHRAEKLGLDIPFELLEVADRLVER